MLRMAKLKIPTFGKPVEITSGAFEQIDMIDGGKD